jgi:hypothetical protein
LAPEETPAGQVWTAHPVFPKKKKKKENDERETLSKTRRASRPKALLILRIRGEIRPRDQKWGQIWPGSRKGKTEHCHSMYIPLAIAYS